MTEEKERAPKPQTLIDCLQDMVDPRVERTRDHKLIDILVIGLCTMITVGENFTDMEDFGNAKRDWLEGFLELPNGIPSHDTFNRVFSAIDPVCFLDCFVRWVQATCPALGDEVVAIDGKALRRALDQGKAIPYIVSAWAVENGLVLGQVKVDEKSNEITAIPELLQALELTGCVVTIDAMGCQKEIAADIIDEHAHYVLALKGNHSTAHQEVQEFFDDAVKPCATQCNPTAHSDKMDFLQTVEKTHGRIETRRYWQTTDIAWFADLPLWKGLCSFGMVESIRTIKSKSTIERRYYLSSLPLNAQRFGQAVRNHWGVENNVHWVMDVLFGEDQSRARTKYAAQNLATLRRIVLNLLKKDTSTKTSLRRKRTKAALDERFLADLIGI
jgi:predicted transposase YbfD/YdcC